jgi:hypothetical protein
VASQDRQGIVDIVAVTIIESNRHERGIPVAFACAPNGFFKGDRFEALLVGDSERGIEEFGRHFQEPIGRKFPRFPRPNMVKH